MALRLTSIAMRVVHVISNLGLGGAETMLVRLVREQAGGTVEHAVISFLPGGVYAQTLRDLGAEVIELEGTRSLRSAALLRPLRRCAGARQAGPRAGLDVSRQRRRLAGGDRWAPAARRCCGASGRPWSASATTGR